MDGKIALVVLGLVALAIVSASGQLINADICRFEVTDRECRTCCEAEGYGGSGVMRPQVKLSDAVTASGSRCLCVKTFEGGQLADGIQFGDGIGTSVAPNGGSD